MKYKLTLLLLTVVLINTSCVKELLKKKDETKTPTPEEKYYGTTWKATKIAQDNNGNNQADANEMYSFTGTSILQLTSEKKFSYTFNTSTGSLSMNGTWALSADAKNLTITDPVQGSMRLDYKTDTEFQTEPIPINGGGAAWIFYTKQ